MYYLSKALIFTTALAAVCVAQLHPATTVSLRIATLGAFVLQGLFIRQKGSK